MGSLPASLNSLTPLPDNAPSRSHEQTNLELFIAIDLSSSISTGSNLLLIKANVLKFVNDFLFILFNRSGFKVISIIKSLTPVHSGAFSSGTEDEAPTPRGHSACPLQGAAHMSPTQPGADRWECRSGAL